MSKTRSLSKNIKSLATHRTLRVCLIYFVVFYGLAGFLGALLPETTMKYVGVTQNIPKDLVRIISILFAGMGLFTALIVNYGYIKLYKWHIIIHVIILVLLFLTYIPLKSQISLNLIFCLGFGTLISTISYYYDKSKLR